MKICAVLVTLLFATCSVSHGVETDAAPYNDDPAITTLLKQLDDRSSLFLPKVNVNCGDLAIYSFDKRGPGQRDYCNKMAFAKDRQTALYAGGNHQVPHRMNDVWEYHLGSNTWHLLYAPDGGNPGKHKAAYFLTSRTLVRNPEHQLSQKEREQIEAYREWWNANVKFESGHVVTKNDGPIMPAHTWDAFTYDAQAKKLLWGMGANPAGQLSTWAYYSGTSTARHKAQLNPDYTPMWVFDPFEKRWGQYKTSAKCAQLRGMGATMAYLPDVKKTLWYVAAQNVSPAAFEMWLFDAASDEWTELKPNGGQSISTLATKEQVAPGSELQTAYSPKHRALVAVLKQDTFLYDVAANEWSKLATDKRIYGHDARSVFAYDSHSDSFLLAFPPDGRGKELKLAAFNLNDKIWKFIEPKGDPLPITKFGGYMGYYDSIHNVFVVQGRYNDRLWVYRHAN